jgi:hypothetical protein
MLNIILLSSLAIAQEDSTAKSTTDTENTEATSTDSTEKEADTKKSESIQETENKSATSKESEASDESVEEVSIVSEFEQQMTLAKQQIQSNNLDGAKASLSNAEKAMAKVGKILTSNEISQVWYYRGVIASVSGEDPLDAWRQALIINLGQQWDAALVNDDAAQDAFLALKTEVQNRRILSVQHPEEYGHAKIYVDGFLRAPGDFVYQGEHFAQIECPKGDVHGKWLTFEKTVKWIKMCPYKFDVTDMPESEAVDEWDMFGGVAGGDESAPEVNMSNQMVTDSLLERMNKPTLYGSLGSAVLAGTLYAVALQNNAKFVDVDTDLSVTELDSLRSQTNIIAISSATLGILSGGLYMYSMSTARVSK